MQRWRISCLAIGLAAFLAMIVIPPPDGLPPAAWRATAAVGLIALWWMTEAIPLATTALLPLILFPALGIADIAATAESYAHPLILLFLGGFLMARAIEKSGLSRRIAFQTVRFAGGRPEGVIAALMCATAFLSMWISNTATAMVMMPVAASILSGVPAPAEDHDRDRIGPALMLGIAYAATIGGMASLIGTPPNALFAGFMAERYGVTIGFAEWMIIGLPVAIVLLPLTWLLLVKGTFGIRSHAAQIGSISIPPTGAPPSSAEWRVGVIVTLAACLWLLRPVIDGALPSLGITDTTIAIGAAILLFVVPDGASSHRCLLDWADAAKIRWDVLILFGGGLALASAISETGLAAWIGNGIAYLGALPLFLLILVVAAIIVYLGELASNTAMAAIFLPIGGATAVAMGEPPLLLTLPIALSASIGFMLPVATPPNAIVFGTGRVTSRQMLTAGAILDPIGIFAAAVASVTIGYWLFS